MRKIKYNKNKLYGIMANGGIGLSMLGLGTFLISYVSGNHMNPVTTMSFLGMITAGGLSNMYGTLKQNYKSNEEVEEEYDPYENVYDLDLLELQRKELKIVESRFEIEKTTMDTKTVNLIKYNLLKEKLLIKKVLESLDTDLPSIEAEADLIVSMIIETGYDEDYLDYREKVLSTNVVDFPKYNTKSKSKSKSNNGKTKILEFPSSN